jgi:hypothetical protein
MLELLIAGDVVVRVRVQIGAPLPRVSRAGSGVDFVRVAEGGVGVGAGVTRGDGDSGRGERPWHDMGVPPNAAAPEPGSPWVPVALWGLYERGTVKPDLSALFTFIHSFVRPE